jgi:hypothetical protein
MHDFKGFEPVENTVEDISRLVQKARLDEVTPEDGTEMLHSQGQQCSKKRLGRTGHRTKSTQGERVRKRR